MSRSLILAVRLRRANRQSLCRSEAELCRAVGLDAADLLAALRLFRTRLEER